MNQYIAIVSFICTVLVGFSIKTSAIANQPQNSYVANNLVVQNSNINERSQNDRTIPILILGTIGTGLLFWYLSRSRRGTKVDFTQTRTNSDTPILDRVSPKLRRQLLRLINDPKTVNRLLTGIHQSNPNRSPNWLAEKAIYDLRRGR